MALLGMSSGFSAVSLSATFSLCHGNKDTSSSARSRKTGSRELLCPPRVGK